MQTNNKFSLLINQLLDAPSSDPDDARRRKILNVILVFVASLTLFVIIAVSIVGIIRGSSTPDTPIIYLVCVALLVGTALLYVLNRVVAGWVASALFLLFLMVVFVFSDTPDQLVDGRSLFVFTIPIIMASMLLRPSYSFAFAALIVLEMYIVINMNALPLRVNPVAIAVFFMVASISWLSSRTLENALRDLRIINAELDQRVIDRTRELSESLTREAAQASQREAILNSIADGVVVFDKKGTAIVANPSLTSLTGKSQNEIVGREVTNLINSEELPLKQRGDISEFFSQPGKVPTFRVNWGRKTLSVNAAEVRDGNGQSMGTVAVFRDVTREAELERMKDTFVAVVSHELRTPLNAILGFAEMIKETVYGPVNDNQRKASVRIMDNTNRLLSIVSELLDQAQIQSGRMKINFVSCKPADLLTDLQETMEKIAENKGIKLDTELDQEMPETLIGDPQRLQQIMINLTNNAIKFSGQGDKVHVSIRPQGKKNWQIQVEDTGEGIPEESIGLVFETFRQVEGSATRKHGGVGLGLSIVKQLAELMGGTVTVKSQVGTGSVFTVSLPLISQ
ncbi:MAG: PAS domain S-box protein [Chloroflexi bacterium]|nr:PAS domain S-box protein [Chloroflexota bacterium]